MTTSHIRLDRITKSYPGVRALDGVSFEIGIGETLGFVGENGAGKSTLMDILSGIQPPSGGQYLLHGKPVVFATPTQATSAGVFRVHQEQALISVYPVYQNMFLGLERHFDRGGVMQFAEMRKRARRVLKELDVDIDAAAVTGKLNFGTRQIVEIARVIAQSELLNIKHPLVLLDEPTASISGRELDVFYRIVDLLKSQFSASILFVSHRLEEVLRISDRVLVLKDGRVVADDLADPTESGLHRLMVGRERVEDFYSTDRQLESFGDTVLKVSQLRSDRFQDVSFELRSGEILGVGGLVQSGKTELGRAIFGVEHSTGSVEICGTEASGLPTDARIGLGSGYIPLNRHLDGVMLSQSIEFNMLLPSLASFERLGFLNRNAMRATSYRESERFRVKAPNTEALVGSLSGGNQQKIVLAKWLAKNPKVLVVDNPTRGVDAGAKEEIYGFLRDFAEAGGAILLISDDLVELIEMSNGILFLAEGRLSNAVPAPIDNKPSEHDIIHMMF